MIDVIKGTYKKNRITRKRAYPWTFLIGRMINSFFSIMTPILVYYFMFNGKLDSSFISYSGTSDYITFIVAGIAINTFGISTLMSVGRGLIGELREGTLDSILISPSSRIGYFLGIHLEQFTYSLVQFGIVLLIGALFGANLIPIFNLKSLIIVCIASFSFFSMATLLSSVMLFTRDTFIVQNTLFLSLTILSGVAFPIQYLPDVIENVSNIIPMTLCINLFRSIVISGNSLESNLNLIVSLLSLSTIYFVIGISANKIVERKLIGKIFG